MDELKSYQAAIEKVLQEYAAYLAADDGSSTSETIIDHARGHYLLLDLGWQGYERIYNVVLHLDIIDGKIWIQQDHIEDGIATDLEAAGVPKEHIVLGFKSPFLRQFTEYAAA